jgi:hypothetical protein
MMISPAAQIGIRSWKQDVPIGPETPNERGRLENIMNIGDKTP